ATLLRRRAPTQQPSLKPIQATGPPIASQVFAEGVAAARGGLNRDPEQPPSRRTPCYAQIGMVQTNGQPMGSEHSGEGIQNPLQEPPFSRSGIEVVRYENSAEVYHTPGYGYKYKENDPQGSVKQDQGSSTRAKQATERWVDDVEMSRELYWEIPVNVVCTAAGSPYVSLTSRAKE
ncbi:hypothetical protein AYI69_g7847, partial [Smittium culicis]